MNRVALCASLFGVSVFAQPPAKVDFAADVMPIFRQNCVPCHGAAVQQNGLRLDRKSSVMKLNLRRVVAGNSANSLLYHRLTGSEYGPQMPPTGALKPAQIETIKKWIDGGADWPDSLANEEDLPPLNAKAVAMVDALRRNDRQAFQKYVDSDAKLLNARGPDGATPFMFAVLYAPAASLEGWLKKGADPNHRDDAHATALMWAVTSLEKTRVLMNHGADVNAVSDEMRTPLMIAAGRPGNSAVVKLLLEHGANANPTKKPGAESSPLIEAATAGDAASMQLLIGHGADVKAAGEPGLSMAITMRCAKCLDLLLAGKPDKAALTGALQEVAILPDVDSIKRLVDLGADVNAADGTGRTPLIYAAGSDLLSLDVVKLLVERGANVNAKVAHANAVDSGTTALDNAKLRGDTPVVQYLIQAGAKGTAVAAPVLKTRQGNTVQSAIEHSLPLLQRADASFFAKAACISCHNNSLGAMTVGLVRKTGFPVDEPISAKQVKANIASIEKGRDRLYQGFITPVEDFFGPGVMAYVLLGLDAEHYKPDLNTDAVAFYLKMHQMPDGQFPYDASDSRPPLCSDYVSQTAIVMRALQLYAPVTDKAAYQKSIELAAGWLATAKSQVNEDRTWRVMGLAWAGNKKDALQTAVQELLAVQGADGGWPDIASMQSNAYATGKSLVALRTAGMATSEPVFQRGIQFLLNTQLEDGSWYVKTRALAFQPYFDNGFPHGYDQWISAAGTGWATMALSLAAPARHAPSIAGIGLH